MADKPSTTEPACARCARSVSDEDRCARCGEWVCHRCDDTQLKQSEQFVCENCRLTKPKEKPMAVQAFRDLLHSVIEKLIAMDAHSTTARIDAVLKAARPLRGARVEPLQGEFFLDGLRPDHALVVCLASGENFIVMAVPN